MTKLEEVARAICQAMGSDPDSVLLMYPTKPVWTRYEGAAGAALKAMREPSQGQMQAGMNSGQAPLCDGEIRNLWEAMIDALLSESPG